MVRMMHPIIYADMPILQNNTQLVFCQEINCPVPPAPPSIHTVHDLRDFLFDNNNEQQQRTLKDGVFSHMQQLT